MFPRNFLTLGILLICFADRRIWRTSSGPTSMAHSISRVRFYLRCELRELAHYFS